MYSKVVNKRLEDSSIRVTVGTYAHVIGRLQEAVVQRFDDLLATRGIEYVDKPNQGCR